MGLFIIYRTDTGSETARPVIAWGHCPDGDEASQTQAASEVAIPAPAGLKEDQDYTYDTVSGTLSATTAAEPIEQEADNRRRIEAELRESEWSQLPDAPLTAAELVLWTQYRAELRGLSSKPEWPAVGVWPVKPTSTEF